MAGRRGIAYVLIAVWFAFTLTGALQHCCRPLAAKSDNTTQSAAISTGSVSSTVDNHGGQSDDDDHCPELTSLLAVVPEELIPPPATPDLPVHLAGYTETALAPVGFTSAFTYPPPTPPARLYLTTLRLRI